MRRATGGSIAIIALLVGCGLLSPQIEVVVENNSDQRALIEVVDGVIGWRTPLTSVSRGEVPAGQTTTLSLMSADEWTLLVNGDAVYDSLHVSGTPRSLSLGLEIAPNGSVNVLAP